MHLKSSSIFEILTRTMGAIVIAAPLAFGTAAQSAGVGEAPDVGSETIIPEGSGPEAATGLKVFFRKFGLFSASVDAAGSNGASHTVKIKKPAANSTVVRAYLMAASYDFSAPRVINNGDITIDGTAVTWNASETNTSVANSVFFYNVLGDVTPVARAKLDGNPAGTYTFTLAELVNNSNIDGEILVVVFNNPDQAKKQTVALMFGGQQLGGDRFELSFAKNFGRKAGKHAFMGLGISFGFQGSTQYSTIDVNGQRISTSAGGQDDGIGANGALITAGGFGDSKANPPNANATPNGNPRYDDEQYDLLPFITKNTTNVVVSTSNPSDDDNIFFAWFEISAKTFVNKDKDGDGLLDDWEKNGYDHDGDGVIDVPLHTWGFSPNHKDICVMYAWMKKGGGETKSHRPSLAVRNAVIKAFKRAPVSNPDGVKGIKLHFRSKGSVPHDSDLSPVWTEFDALMNPKVSEAERVICHRMLNAHQYSGGTSSGLARGIPASDFIESLGGFSTNPGTRVQRAGTIMHELGHNLGLRHGGPDDINWKPNHLSIMSYLNQLDWLSKNGNPFLDYERFDLNSLNEARLSEPAGLNRVGSDLPLRNYAVRWYKGGASKSKATGANKNVDWNDDGDATDIFRQDLNRTGTAEVLAARHVEWDEIIYDGGSVGASGNKVPNLNLATEEDALVELTEEMYLEFRNRSAPAEE